jgi:hypothetical protein
MSLFHSPVFDKEEVNTGEGNRPSFDGSLLAEMLLIFPPINTSADNLATKADIWC